MAPLRPGTLRTGLAKRSVTIRGHPTSFTLEDPFWQALREEASRQKVSLARLVTSVDLARAPGTNLSSALRVHVLTALQARLAAGEDLTGSARPPVREGTP